jgi:hypothetical protein
MKIDIEGYEYNLIKGIEPSIVKYKPSVLLALHPQIVANTISGKSIVKKIVRRSKLFREHISILRVINKFPNISRTDGVKISSDYILKKIFFKGCLAEEEKELILSF